MKYRSLQILRSIAAIFVVLYHIRGYFIIIDNNTSTFFNLFNEYFSLGAFLFFAISGFLMSYLIDIEYKQFLLKRLLRIYPAYIIAVVLCLFIKIVVFESVTQPQILKSLTLLPLGNIPYVLNVEWTLIYEVFFYFICFPFTFKYLKKYFPYFLGLWTVLIIVGAGWFKIPTLFLPTINTIFFSYFNLCFITGAMVYYIYKHYQIKSRVANSMMLTLSLIIIILFEEFGKTLSVIANTKYIAFAISMGLIIYASLQLLKDNKSKLMNGLERFGEYSYALYLVHVPIITITFVVVRDLWKLELNTITGFFVLFLSLGVGYLYGKVDIKIHKLIREQVDHFKGKGKI